jgi:hypothetical protein
MKIQKKGQEEMVGFALIIIVVAVIVLIFVSFGLRGQGTEETKSNELYNFLQSSLDYTSRCATENLPDYSIVRDLIDDCNDNFLNGGVECVNGERACFVLEDTLDKMLKANWFVGEDSDVKGYEYQIYSGEDRIIVNITEGLKTRNFKIPNQPLSKGEDIIFKVYF